MLNICRALPDEYASIGALTVDAYAPVLTFGDADPYRQTLMDAAGRAAAAELWSATSGDQLVGTVTVCRPSSRYAEIAALDELEVRMLAVAPAAQGRGVGVALMERIHETARTEQFAAVVLSVVESNVSAVAFYTALGYTRARDRDWEPVPDITLQVWRWPVPQGS
ncbi:MAG: GNAT family N-acetyltransferase [Actinomycetia bacterium]|nr:GNAT family N-acetyltransferase [Actinomycetes bacterium]